MSCCILAELKNLKLCNDDTDAGNTVVTAAVVETQKPSKLKTTLKLDFKFDSMTLVLYSPNEHVVCKYRHR